MPTFAYSVEVRAAAPPLFRLSQDYDRRLAWDPFLRVARLMGTAAPGVGARAWCVARYGLGMETEYVTYRPPEVVAVRMTRGPWMLRRFAGSWRFREVESGLTRVTFSYHLESRPRWLCGVLDPLLMAVFARDTRRRLAAFRRAAETTDILSGYAVEERPETGAAVDAGGG